MRKRLISPHTADSFTYHPQECAVLVEDAQAGSHAQDDSSNWAARQRSGVRLHRGVYYACL